MGKILVVSQRNLTEKWFFTCWKEENEIAVMIFGSFQVDRSVNADILRWAHVYCVEGSAMKPVWLTWQMLLRDKIRKLRMRHVMLCLECHRMDSDDLLREKVHLWSGLNRHKAQEDYIFLKITMTTRLNVNLKGVRAIKKEIV